MCRIMEELKEEGLREGRAEGQVESRLDALRNLMANLKLPLADALKAMGVPQEEWEKYTALVNEG